MKHDTFDLAYSKALFDYAYAKGTTRIFMAQGTAELPEAQLTMNRRTDLVRRPSSKRERRLHVNRTGTMLRLGISNTDPRPTFERLARALKAGPPSGRWPYSIRNGHDSI